MGKGMGNLLREANQIPPIFLNETLLDHDAVYKDFSDNLFQRKPLALMAHARKI
jgi:hypothetical protein